MVTQHNVSVSITRNGTFRAMVNISGKEHAITIGGKAWMETNRLAEYRNEILSEAAELYAAITEEYAAVSAGGPSVNVETTTSR